MPLLCGVVRTLQPYRKPVFVAIKGLVGRVRAVAKGDQWIVSSHLVTVAMLLLAINAFRPGTAMAFMSHVSPDGFATTFDGWFLVGQLHARRSRRCFMRLGGHGGSSFRRLLVQ